MQLNGKQHISTMKFVRKITETVKQTLSNLRLTKR